jgi:hypothetical protein
MICNESSFLFPHYVIFTEEFCNFRQNIKHFDFFLPATEYLKMRVLVSECPLSLNRFRFPFRVKMKLRTYGELICEDARHKARYINVCVPVHCFPDLYCQSVFSAQREYILKDDISYYYTRNTLLLFLQQICGRGVRLHCVLCGKSQPVLTAGQGQVHQKPAGRDHHRTAPGHLFQ